MHVVFGSELTWLKTPRSEAKKKLDIETGNFYGRMWTTNRSDEMLLHLWQRKPSSHRCNSCQEFSAKKIPVISLDPMIDGDHGMGILCHWPPSFAD